MKIKYIILRDSSEKKLVLSKFYDEIKHQYDRKIYKRLLKRTFDNTLPFKFPELVDFSIFSGDGNKIDLK
ncbi:MAG: hypothetical protein ACFFG0_06455 [Candidatus Thorarchaeota archaeon]